jgi:ribosomal protein S18 acetylase RimI-like enzyme
MLSSAEGGGLVLVAEDGDEFVGFAASWIELEENVAETSDSNRFGFISDICVLSKYRGKRIANQLLEAITRTLIRLASGASGSECWRQTGLEGWPMNAQVSNRMK